ncbi:MAG TPA: hypothetical protein VGB05_03825, partial [Pyrinomonadaceae bacterium]
MIEVDDTKPGAGEPAQAALGAAGAAARDTQPAPHIEPLVLQPDFKTGDRSQYHVAELLAYHDLHFV